MLIKELINKYSKQGFNYRNAQNLAAEEIVIHKIATSPVVDHVALKGACRSRRAADSRCAFVRVR